MKWHFLLGVLVLAVTAIVACNGPVPTPTVTPTPAQTPFPTANGPVPTPTVTPTPAHTRPFPQPLLRRTTEPGPTPAGEQIDWSPCGTGLECGYIQVPADYRDPEAGSILILVNVHRATSQHERIGYLFVNPGGPGESGVELVRAIRDGAFPDDVVAHFDIVGFDPRGVGESEPFFACGIPGEQLALLATIDGAIDAPDEIAAGGSGRQPVHPVNGSGGRPAAQRICCQRHG